MIAARMIDEDLEAKFKPGKFALVKYGKRKDYTFRIGKAKNDKNFLLQIMSKDGSIKKVKCPSLEKIEVYLRNLGHSVKP